MVIMKIQKTCKIHGELGFHEILASARTDTGRALVRLKCKICMREKKDALLSKNKKCKYEDCSNYVIDLNTSVCNACRYSRRKNKPIINANKFCVVHGELKSEDTFIYDGIYKCKICKNINRSKVRSRDSEDTRKRNLKVKFNITIEQYEKMALEQNNLCKICNKPESALDCKNKGEEAKIRRLAVDHCATTNKIRGLLCIKCNSMIGSSKDNPDILRAGAKYLES